MEKEKITKEEFKEKIELTEADKKLQCLEYIREKTECGLGLISKCVEILIENLKNKPKNKMDVGLSLKMEWQEYDLRNQ